MPIPKIIWQTYDSLKEELPNYIKAISSTWEQSSLEYKYFSNEYAEDFISKNYNQDLLNIVQYAKIPMVRADIFRLVMIYEFGGLYADIDTILLNPVEEWIDFNKDIFLIERLYDNFLIKNDLFGFSPKHPIIKEILEEVIFRCKKQIKAKQEILPTHTGPPVFDFVIKQHDIEYLRNNGLNSEKLQTNYLHIGGLTLKDNIEFFRYQGSKKFCFEYLNSLYKDIDMDKIDIKIYIKKSGYGS
jgi:mannosyltransferase OCH1-like enzyme